MRRKHTLALDQDVLEGLETIAASRKTYYTHVSWGDVARSACKAYVEEHRGEALRKLAERGDPLARAALAKLDPPTPAKPARPARPKRATPAKPAKPAKPSRAAKARGKGGRRG